MALVTGATGMLGQALVARLVGEGTEVLAPARSRPAVDAVVAMGARPLYSDLENLGRWREEARSAEVVWHLARPRVAPPVHTFRARRNARLARRGAASVADVAGGRPVVAVSSGLTYGDRAEPTDERAPTAPLALARADAAAERALSGPGLRVLRTGFVYGSGGLMGALVAALRARRHRIVGPGQNLWSLLSVHDAVEALIRLADAPPGVYPASEHTERPPTQNEVIDALCRGGLRKPDRAPRWLANATIGGPMAQALAASQWLVSDRLRGLGWSPASDWRSELPELAAQAPCGPV